MRLKEVGNWIMAAAFPAAIAGCTVGPNYKPPAMKVPGAFSATQPATRPTTDQATISIQRWWETFNDPTLDSLVDRAVRTNIDLRIAQSRVREARAQLTIQQAAIYPNANADGGYNKLRLTKEGFFLPTGGGGQPGTLSGGGGSTNGGGTLNHASPAIRRGPDAGAGASSGFASAFNRSELQTFQGGFDASWELDVFGGVRRSVEAARADEQATVEARRDTMISLLSEVARNYIQLRGVQRQLAIAYENIRSQQDTLELTRSRFKAGLATDLDVARAEAQVNTTRATVPGSLTSLQQSVHRIAVLLGEQPTALEAELLAKAAPIPAGPPTVPVGIPSELLRRRPDVRRAERQLAAATARVGAATADLFPRFSLTGSLGLASGTFHNIGRLDSIYYSVGPSISWPIFDAGRITANIKVQNERQLQAAEQYEAVVLTSLEDVENAIIAYSQEQSRRESLQAAVDANRRAVELANQLYQKGLTDFLNVLDAQRNLFASEDELVQSDSRVSADVVALYKALGGGWDSLETPPELQMNPNDTEVTPANQ
jgi:NodT family efflux transporter outer membrane factor (OMF) lipoprotein